MFWSSCSSSSSILGQVPSRQPGLTGRMSFEFLFVFHPWSAVVLMYDVDVFMGHVYAFCMYPNYYVMVRCNDIHLAKACQYALLSLVGPSSSFRIESHIGRDSFLGCGTSPAPRRALPRIVWLPVDQIRAVSPAFWSPPARLRRLPMWLSIVLTPAS